MNFPVERGPGLASGLRALPRAINGKTLSAAFVTGMSGLSIFGIGGAFWGLVFGCLVSLLAEREDFASMRGGTRS